MASEPAESVEFFENRIRPVLVEHCYECHAADADEIGGSLLLDSSDAMLTGGDSGPAIQPGEVESSPLVLAIRYESTEMPPTGKLPDSVIRDFEEWIAAGATDPRDTPPAASVPREKIDIEEGRQFWAFQPLSFTEPEIEPYEGSRGPIDQFLGQRLQESGVSPNAQSSDELRLRRLAFDLTGLPPSIELQQRWMADPSWENWERIVDEMLDSQGFAEHWARHWMDVARYADSNGSDFNATFHEAWRYRDYLVRSFASDRPFDQMIRQQIAGDQLPFETDEQRHDNLVATTFLMLGTKMLSERDKTKLELDVVDEQIDTIGRAFLGLTLGCARCHDHKFDPVPTTDYYALAGIFKSTVTLKGESQRYVSTWNRVSLPTTEEHRAAVREYEAATKSLKSDIAEAEKSLKDAEAGTSDVQLGIVIDDTQATKTGTWKESTYTKGFIGKGYVHDDNSQKGKTTIQFSAEVPDDGKYEVRVAYSANTNRASKVPVTIETSDGTQTVTINQQKNDIAPFWTTLGTFEFSSSSPAVVTLSNRETNGYVIADAVQFLSADDLHKLNHPDQDDASKAKRARIEAAQSHLAALKTQLKELTAQKPPPLPQAMAPTDRATPKISDSPVHIRGEVNNHGQVVPRGFLQVCSSGEAAIPNPRGSGRLDLADWLTDPDHPLVARVFVNRVWMHLMGEGLVRTVDNFGERGERPSHPELLDYLATQFVRGGWHLKPLLRDIVNSAAYHRASDYNAASSDADPENRLWWRMHRRRLPAESIRDAMLAATGTLSRTPLFDPMKSHGVLVSGNDGNSTEGKITGIATPCRSIYLPIVRGFLSPMMTALDAADPDLLVGRRPTTNVPGQALVLLNAPEINQWANTTADRVMRDAEDFEARLNLVYQLCLQRLPTEDDKQLAKTFFTDDRQSPEAWQQWVAALFAGTEFRLLD
ncbi:DUF1553 domain-containing protein [Aporhodopirellula aestuarii]|uniref:DUF1553 domain-containing protein n=1 Tax=Aporhodopirellula aestuarii TaxID=2950107 RepID=A0ABT0UAF3_9BACT|nr:DUF1553 domain-containing protein [Aporhodopirellula aestuarii]MCM2373358.1 DUF1553 domain-containing protein [Aporhodopirellula aestuarii]